MTTLQAQTASGVKITILSTMLADTRGVGEWGFSALVETGGKRILFDVGARPTTVRDNAAELKVDLSGISELVLSHNHADHTGGLQSLREKFNDKGAFATAYIASHFFLRDTIPAAMKKERDSVAYVKAGGRFIVVKGFMEIAPGVYLTGPVPRTYPEENYPKGRVLKTVNGTIPDNIPEDMSMVIKTPQGLVLLAGCGHAGIVNTMEYIQREFPQQKIIAAIGGFHLLDTKDDKLQWTAQKIKEAGVQFFIGAHCTGLNAVYLIREVTGLKKSQCLVGSVGTTFTPETGITTGWLK